MRSLLHVCRHGAGFCFHCCCSFVCWGVWLVLVLLLIGQLWIATTHTLELPGPVLRYLEHQADALGLTLRCKRVLFTPSGHLQVENFTVGVSSFDEPILKGSLLRTRIDPWGTLIGYEEARHLSLSGIEVWTPAPLSPSGKAEALLDTIDAELHLTKREWTVEHLSLRCGSATMVASGRLPTEFILPAGRQDSLQGSAWQKPFLAALRRAAELRPQLAAAEGARLELRFQPRSEKALRVDAKAWIERLRLNKPVTAESGPLTLAAQFVIGTARQPFVLDVSTAYLQVADVRASDLAARIRGAWQTDSNRLRWRIADAKALELRMPKFDLRYPSVRVEREASGVWLVQSETSLAGTPIEAKGVIDEASFAGKATVVLNVTQELVGWIGSLIGHDLLAYASPQGPAWLRGEVVWDKDRKLVRADGWIEAAKLPAYKVPIDYISGHVSWDGRHFLASPAFARIGDDFANGSYGMDAKTRDFRFLLQGRLRPPAIAGWFREWWPRLWSHFDFSAASPEADVDVQGQWGAGYKSSVFVGAEGRRPVIREVSLERARTRLFVRPHFLDVLEGIADRKEGSARGWFRRLYDVQADAWKAIDFDIVSTFELAEAARVFGAAGAKIIEPYAFEKTPKVAAKGHIEGPASGNGVRESIDFDVVSEGGFRVSNFPLQDVSFTGKLEGGDLTLTRIRARAGKGSIDAIARVWGDPDNRKIAFGGQLSGANLGETIRTVETYAALKAGRPPEKNSMQDKLVDTRLDLTASAEGPYLDLFGFTGKGSVKLAGATLGEVKLLGLLSELLPFTSLRFTQATSDFAIERQQIVFPAVRITGHNSAIDANGRYLMDKKLLDFHAKVWPFDQSKNIVQGAMGLVLSPLSQALEVKLEGSLAQPRWSFVLSPFGLLKSIAGGASGANASGAPEETKLQQPAPAEIRTPARDPKAPINVPAP